MKGVQETGLAFPTKKALEFGAEHVWGDCMALKNLVNYLKSPFISLSLIFLALILVYESSVGSEGVLFLLIYESMMLSMFLLVIMGKENLPGDVDFVALILVAMPAVVLLFSGTFLGVVAGVLLIGGVLWCISRA